jgi:AbrB family looped-hinge helix DNA binding protein
VGKKVKLRRVASSLVVTIPKDIADGLNWTEGSTIEITITGVRSIQLVKG